MSINLYLSCNGQLLPFALNICTLPFDLYPYDSALPRTGCD